MQQALLQLKRAALILRTQMGAHIEYHQNLASQRHDHWADRAIGYSIETVASIGEKLAGSGRQYRDAQVQLPPLASLEQVARLLHTGQEFVEEAIARQGLPEPDMAGAVKAFANATKTLDAARSAFEDVHTRLIEYRERTDLGGERAILLISGVKTSCQVILMIAAPVAASARVAGVFATSVAGHAGLLATGVASQTGVANATGAATRWAATSMAAATASGVTTASFELAAQLGEGQFDWPRIVTMAGDEASRSVVSALLGGALSATFLRAFTVATTQAARALGPTASRAVTGQTVEQVLAFVAGTLGGSLLAVTEAVVRDYTQSKRQPTPSEIVAAIIQEAVKGGLLQLAIHAVLARSGGVKRPGSSASVEATERETSPVTGNRVQPATSYAPLKAPSAVTAAGNQAAARVAAAKLSQRAHELAALLHAKRARKEVIETDVVILGAGQSAIFDAATRSKAGVNIDKVVTAVPRIFAIAPAGSLFANSGSIRMAQKPKDLVAGSLNTQVGEFTSNHREYAKASDVTDALSMAAAQKGLLQFHATVSKVEHNPRDGTWPSTKQLRVTAEGVSIYCDEVDSALGLGTAARLGTRAQAANLARRGPDGVSHEQELEARGLLLKSRERVAAAELRGKTVTVIGSGPNGATSVTQALEQGAARVLWYGAKRTNQPDVIDARSKMAHTDLSDTEKDVFWTAYQARNRLAFKSDKVEYLTGFQDTALSPDQSKPILVKSAQGERATDVIISAIGWEANVPEGVAAPGSLQPVIKIFNGQHRVVALEGVSADGQPNGIRLVERACLHQVSNSTSRQTNYNYIASCNSAKLLTRLSRPTTAAYWGQSTIPASMLG